MGAVRGATSLVELILKKWGDDAEGAAKELEEKIGFPESVANRIATGELPMDPKSVEERRIAQGYLDELYHGSTHNLLEFDGSVTNVDNDFGRGIYLTDDTYDASENYAGVGADLTNRLERHAEDNWFQTDKFEGPDHVRTIGGEDFTKAQWDDLEYYQKMAYLRRDAYDEIAGETRGVMYPVAINEKGVVNSTDSIRDSVEMKDWDDYLNDAAEDLEPSYRSETKESLLDPDGEFYDDVYEHAVEMQYSDESSPTMIAYDVMRRYGLDEGPFELEHLDTWQDLRDVMDEKISNGWYQRTTWGVHDLRRHNERGHAGAWPEGLQRYVWRQQVLRHGGGAGNHTIMFPGSENQIRSVNTAFDHKYRAATSWATSPSHAWPHWDSSRNGLTADA